MNRRQLLQALAAAGIAPLLMPRARAGAETVFETFAAARKHRPWLAGWETLESEALAPRHLAWRGKLPTGLRGTLYRNGPGRFDRGGQRYHHWFDGDGLLQAWRIEADGVRHAARFVETHKLVAEREAGRFLYMGAGTHIADARPMRNADDANTANTSVIAFGGELLALWEGGSAWRVDAETLASHGPKTWRDDAAALPFSAHPLRDADGSLWNFGALPYIGGGTLLIWHIGADGALRTLTPLDIGHRGYLHSFAMTRQHLLFVLAPLMLEEGLGDQAYFEALRWRGEQLSLLLIVDKNDPQQVRRVELPAGIAYHWADAREDSAGTVELHGAWTERGDLLQSAFAELMRGETFAQTAPSSMVRITVPRQGAPTLESLGIVNAEFPDFDRRHDGGRLYTLAQPQPTPAGYLDTVVALDRQHGREQVFRYGDHHLVEEHRFVPRPGSARRDDGWLVGTAMDWRAGTMLLSVFDAAHIDEGPLCQATLPRTLPLSFHAEFLAA